MAAETEWHEAFKAGQFEPNHDETVDSFDAMNLKKDLLRGVYEYGFENPSAVQQRAIMPIIKGSRTPWKQQQGGMQEINDHWLRLYLPGNDVLVRALLDSDELATLSISILQKIDFDVPDCQALILTTTRESALQIQEVTNDIAKYTKTKCYACIRGSEEALRNGSQIVVGTPGYVMKNLIRHDSFDVNRLKMVAVDNVEHMFSRGFEEHVTNILQLLPQGVQAVLFSAEMSQEVLDLSMQFSREPVRILTKKNQVSLEGIEQFCVMFNEDDPKLDIFSYLRDKMTKAIIFCRLRKTVEWLASELTTRDFDVSAMHGDMMAFHRSDMMKEFRQGSLRILIATDMLARSIDVQQVPLVINYDIPDTCEKYGHRIGHGGLFGRTGVVINLATADEVHLMRKIEEDYDTQIVEVPREHIANLIDRP